MDDIRYKQLKKGWLEAVPPPGERKRIEALYSYRILDTEPSEQFDRITQLVSQQLNTAFALVSLVDRKRQWFKSACGIDAKETPRNQAFCAHAIWSNNPLVVLDASKDPRFKANPLVAGEPKIRFYAGAPLITPSGNRIGTLCAIDTKPRKHFSKKQQKLLTTLAAIVVDELGLHLANIDLEEKSSLKSIFLANMSHELRTPMNGIIGTADLLLEGTHNKAQEKHLGNILHSAEHLLEILNDILDYSKIEAGKLELEETPFSLKSTITEIMQLLKTKSKSQGVKLGLSYPKKFPEWFEGDRLRIGQVLFNLIGNALKFTKKGYVNVRVEKIKCSKQSCKLKLSVEDSGIGMTKEQRSTIFEKFMQADRTTTRQYGGTGLGLAICYELVQMMGGQIGAKSQVGKGSTFWFEIDILRCEKPKNISNSVTSKKASKAPFKGTKILLAEDNRINAAFTIEMLESMGLEVTWAQNGIEAIEILRDEPAIQAVLMDCQMPEMDGFAATKEIKRLVGDGCLGSVPVIALTANAFQSDKEQCLKSGMDDYLSKPVRKDVLQKTISKWLVH